MQRSKWLRLVALLFAFTLIAASCGDDDDDDGGSETSSTSDTEDMVDTEETSDTEDMADTEETGGETAAGNTIDDSLTVYQAAALEPPSGEEAAPSCTGTADGVLKLGGLLPETGNLAFLGPPEFAGAELAVAEINAAGGVLGADVEWSPGDSSDNGDVANATVDRHLEDGVDAILGAASSGVSFTVIDKVTGACVIHFSPANTSPDFTEYADDDLYFRTAPSDVLQGRVLSDLIVQEGSTTVGLMALQDPYGEGLLKFTQEPLEEQGVEIVESFTYDPKAQNFDAEVDKMVSAAPEAIVLIGFDESAQILSSFFEAGIDPAETKIYLVDGNVGNALGEKFSEPGILSGIKGTIPTAELTDEFKDKLLATDPDLIDFTYGPETYDAVVITALATILADSDDPAQIAANINGVTGGGETCTSFEECVALIDAGTTDIDYDGPSGPQAFSAAGEPTEATFAILSYGS